MEKAPDLQPTLEGPRVTVRPMIAEDWEHMYAIAVDPLLWEQHPAKNRYEEVQFREYFEAAMASKSAFTFIEKENGSIIGSSRHHGYDSDKREIEISWSFLGRDYWGGHYNGEIKQLMLKHAFTFVETGVFWVGADNLRSRKAVEKIGGKLRDGIQQRSHGDELFDYVVYEITREGSNPPS